MSAWIQFQPNFLLREVFLEQPPFFGSTWSRWDSGFLSPSWVGWSWSRWLGMVREKSNDIPFPKKKRNKVFLGRYFFRWTSWFFGGGQTGFFCWFKCCLVKSLNDFGNRNFGNGGWRFRYCWLQKSGQFWWQFTTNNNDNIFDADSTNTNRNHSWCTMFAPYMFHLYIK